MRPFGTRWIGDIINMLSRRVSRDRCGMEERTGKQPCIFRFTFYSTIAEEISIVFSYEAGSREGRRIGVIRTELSHRDSGWLNETFQFSNSQKSKKDFRLDINSPWKTAKNATRISVIKFIFFFLNYRKFPSIFHFVNHLERIVFRVFFGIISVKNSKDAKDILIPYILFLDKLREHTCSWNT